MVLVDRIQVQSMVKPAGLVVVAVATQQWVVSALEEATVVTVLTLDVIQLVVVAVVLAALVAQTVRTEREAQAGQVLQATSPEPQWSTAVVAQVVARATTQLVRRGAELPAQVAVVAQVPRVWQTPVVVPVVVVPSVGVFTVEPADRVSSFFLGLVQRCHLQTQWLRQ